MARRPVRRRKRRVVRRRKRVVRRRRRRRLTGLEPRSIRRKLVYVDSFNLNPDLVPPYDTTNFRVNGMFDPQTTVGGHQPFGFDQYMARYNHFRVNKATLTVEFQNSSTNFSTGQSIVGIQLIAADQIPSGLLTTVSSIAEQPHTVYKFLGSHNGAHAQKKLKMSVRPAKFTGQKVTNSNMRGNIAADPLEQCYWRIFVGPIDPTKDGVPIWCTIRITYDATFTEPKEVGPS